MGQKIKKCIDCGFVGDVNSFGKHNMSRDGYDPYCRKCRNKRTAKYRNKKINDPKYKEQQKIAHKNWKNGLSDTEKNKFKCRQICNRAIRAGKIKKENCFLCNDDKCEAHHIDYDYPLNVIWLCKKCHYKVHLIK